MPWDALAIALGLADEVGGEERDVGADDRLDKGEDVFVERVLQQLGVHEVRDVHRLRTLVGGQVGEDALEAVLQGLKAVCWKDRLVEYEVAVVPVLRDFVGSEARGNRGGCGGCGVHDDAH
jgi:hypothetical protein